MLHRIIFLLFVISGTISEEVKPPRIVIVGAGASGIAAASELLQQGFDNVLLLEAENRIGGRVNTVNFDEYVVDLGAQWIHGEKGNVVYEIAYPLNLTDHSDPFEDEVYTSSGELINPPMMKNLTDSYLEYLDGIESTMVTQCDTSIGECFENKLKDCFTRFPELNDTMKRELLWLFDIMQTSLDPADTWYNVSAKGYWSAGVDEGDLQINWKERGYSTMLDLLMKKFPNPEDELPVLNKTILNDEVTKLDYSNDDNTVKITTESGKEYIADHVILTPSLGVLKAQYETLFNPPLPESKIRNIKGLGFGSAGKVFIVFNDTWFNPKQKKTGGYRILWGEEERKRLESDPKTSWLPYALGFFFVEHKPRLLYMWISGKGAALMDNLTDEEVFEETEKLLHNMLSNHYNVTKPTKMIRSKWPNNKHFRGSYSYRSMEAVKTNCSAEQLSEPIVKMGKPIILFAGEATNEPYYGTVHGAIEAGWREAQRLGKLYRGAKDKTATE